MGISEQILRGARSHSNEYPDLDEISKRASDSCRYMRRRAHRDHKPPETWFNEVAKFRGFTPEELKEELNLLEGN